MTALAPVRDHCPTSAYALNLHDVVRLADGTVGYVLSQNYHYGVTWLNTRQKVLCVSQHTVVERLVNIETLLAQCLADDMSSLDMTHMRHVLLHGKDT